MRICVVLSLILFMFVVLVGNYGIVGVGMGFEVIDGVPYFNGKPIVIFGIAWFGFETQSYVPHGLWARNWRDVLRQIRDLEFNAIRIPFCASTLHGVYPNPDDIDYDLNPDLMNLTALEIMDKIIHEAYRLGLFILLDYHRVGCRYIEEVWYNETYSEDRFISDWVFLANRYKNYTNIIGADIKNEPHGKASWGTGDNATDIRLFAERVGKTILRVAPHWLIFVEGVEYTHIEEIDNSNPYPCYWGENLMGVRDFPVRLPKNKIVYAPHVYGPSVYNQSYFYVDNFPDNMHTIWDFHFGFIHKENLGTLAIDEWGGWYRGLDKVWQDKFSEYVISRKIFISFYWALNPNSGDTGGVLLDDWKTPNWDKLEMLNRLKEKMLNQLPREASREIIAILIAFLALLVMVFYVLRYLKKLKIRKLKSTRIL